MLVASLVLLPVTAKPAAAATVPTMDHVFVIVMENHSYSEIIGSSSAPYINSLLVSGSLATNYHGVSHPSLPNYLALTSASTNGITSDCTTCFLSVSNIADTLENGGSTWKAYEESMTSPCFVGDIYPYAQKHDPFIYYNDIRTNAVRCQRHVVPYTQMSVDLRSTATTPNYSFITPGMCNDMHDCSVATGDAWLQNQVPQILNSPAFKTQRSLLALTWDEDDSTAGNHVPLILLGSGVRAGYRSSLAYNHYSLLHTIEAGRGIGSLTGNDGGAATISDVFGTAPPPSTSACTSVAATGSPVSPQVAGTAVQIRASAGGCTNPQYEFWSLAPGSSTWQLAQTYASNAMYAWSTAGKATGAWRFSVWARDLNSGGTAGNVNGTWDAYVAPYYSLTAGQMDPCTGVTASTAPSGTRWTGTLVTITAVASGCTEPRYQFEMLTPGSQTWRIVQPYSSSAVYNWSASGAAQGTYRFIVMVRDNTSPGVWSNYLSSWDAYIALPYTLTGTSCTGVTAISSPSGSATAGTAVTITTKASGCPNPRYQYEILVPGSQTWQIFVPYSTGNILNWNTNGAAKGTFTLIVMVRDAGSVGTVGNSLASWDAYVLISYSLN